MHRMNKITMTVRRVMWKNLAVDCMQTVIALNMFSSGHDHIAATSERRLDQPDQGGIFHRESAQVAESLYSVPPWRPHTLERCRESRLAPAKRVGLPHKAGEAIGKSSMRRQHPGR